MHQGLISIVADDGRIEDYTILMSLLKPHSIRANCAIVSDWVGQPGYMDISQICDLTSLGWEMLSHSKTHSAPLHTLSSDRLYDEIVVSKQALGDMGITTNNFCYPWGGRNFAAKRLISKHYNCAIRVGGGPNSFYYDRFAVNRCVMDNVDINNKERIDFCKKQILTLVDKPLWIVYMVHPAESLKSKDIANGISNLLEYIADCGIPIVTISEAIDIIAKRRTLNNLIDLRVLQARTNELVKDAIVAAIPKGSIRHIQQQIKHMTMMKRYK